MDFLGKYPPPQRKNAAAPFKRISALRKNDATQALEEKPSYSRSLSFVAQGVREFRNRLTLYH
jgi:hypothetical protein